jgi:hypothetical protein
MMIHYHGGAYPKDWGGALPWFLHVMMVCTLIGFGCMTLLGLL